MWIGYEKTDSGTARITALYGDQPEVTVPETVDGLPVTELAPYAFSEKEQQTNTVPVRTEADDGESFSELLAAGRITRVCGDFLQTISLPDTLQSIGELCFYQCRQLQELQVGGGEIEIGSDAFMNCKALSTIRIHASVSEPTSLRTILLQRTQATDVWFDDAAVHFPEYTERYDLIGPAHIFELNIEGEGFRARKCFEGDRFLPDVYDDVFVRASDTEDERTLCTMAALRLTREVSLSEEAMQAYRTYLAAHMAAFVDEVIRRREPAVLFDLVGEGRLDREQIALCLQKMTQARWVEGTRRLLAKTNEVTNQ